MRKLVASLFITLDGVVEAPEQWQLDYFDEEMAAGMGSQIAHEDAVLLGRVTYQEWAGYWPNATDEPYASHINNTQKYVVSTTLDRVPWGTRDNTTLIRGNLREEVTRLQQQPGKNIGVGGSPTLVRSLMQEGLLDELTLLIHPIVVGRGRRLFQDGDAFGKFALAYSKPTRSGVLIATYRPL